MKDFSIKISEIRRVKFTFSQIYLGWIKKFLPWSWGWNSGRALRVLVKWGIPQACKTQRLSLPEGYRGSQSVSTASQLLSQWFPNLTAVQWLSQATDSVPAPSGAGVTKVAGQLDVGDGTQITQKQEALSTTAQSLQPQPILWNKIITEL